MIKNITQHTLIFIIIAIEMIFILTLAMLISLENDAGVHDSAQYQAFIQNTVIDKNYWLQQAQSNTVTGIIIALLAALFIFILNYVFFNVINKLLMKKPYTYLKISFLSSVLAFFTINYFGITSTLDMLDHANISSYL